MNTTSAEDDHHSDEIPDRQGDERSGGVMDDTAEEDYWREHHTEQPFSNKHSYDAFAPAYRTGYEGYARHGEAGKEFEAVEPELQAAYERSLARSSVSSRDSALNAPAKAHITWEKARAAARAAWDRVRASAARRP
jgi:hypothetical protein